MPKAFSKNKLETDMQVYDYALNLLTFRDYSASDMLLKLERKGAEKLFAEKAVAKLKEYDFINEKRYAQRVYEAWLSKKYYGRQHLEAELHKKHVLEEYIPLIMESFTEEEEAARAELACQQFLQKNARKLNQVDQKLQAAGVRFMAARGFSGRQAYIILDKLRECNAD